MTGSDLKTAGGAVFGLGLVFSLMGFLEMKSAYNDADSREFLAARLSSQRGEAASDRHS